MITIGADPEVFLVNAQHKPVSSIGKIGGSKQNPIPIRDGIFLQEDNVTVEYNIPPCETVEAFLKANTDALHIIQQKAESMNLKVSIQASHNMPKKELEDPRAWVFGCEPDFNVHTMDWNPKPNVSNLRAAGGHVHIGFDGDNLEKIELAKHMDLTLGALFSLLDPDKQRKKMYGQAGSIRFKPYGIEYRTLSNFWLTHPYYIKTVFETSKVMATNTADYKATADLLLKNQIITAINNKITTKLIPHLEKVLQLYPIPKTFLNTCLFAFKSTKAGKIDYNNMNKLLDTTL